jgi:hypothetical protein
VRLRGMQCAPWLRDLRGNATPMCAHAEGPPYGTSTADNARPDSMSTAGNTNCVAFAGMQRTTRDRPYAVVQHAARPS